MDASEFETREGLPAGAIAPEIDAGMQADEFERTQKPKVDDPAE